MDIREVCAQAGLAVEVGGGDEWGHLYEADELRFGFAFQAHILCFRYRTTEGSRGWFVNLRSPGENQPSLVFTRVSEADVIQVLLFYFASLRRPAPVSPPRNRKDEQFLLFGS